LRDAEHRHPHLKVAEGGTVERIAYTLVRLDAGAFDPFTIEEQLTRRQEQEIVELGIGRINGLSRVDRSAPMLGEVLSDRLWLLEVDVEAAGCVRSPLPR
jgi:hypothetical protein